MRTEINKIKDIFCYKLIKLIVSKNTKKEKKREITQVKNEKEGITKDSTLKTFMILTGYYEQFYTKKFEHLNDKFLAKCNLPKQAHTHKIENLNSPSKEE